jgi:hypothetical protein
MGEFLPPSRGGNFVPTREKVGLLFPPPGGGGGMSVGLDFLLFVSEVVPMTVFLLTWAEGLGCCCREDVVVGLFNEELEGRLLVVVSFFTLDLSRSTMRCFLIDNMED